MTVPTFLLGMLAAAGQVSPSTPITVTGHQWAPFISPMGEPFRARSVTDDTLADWFYRADRNHDGLLTADEVEADAESFFAKLDSNHDGQIDPDELAQYEYEVAPEIQVNSRTKREPGEPAPKARAADPDDFGGDSGRSRERRRERAAEVDASLGLSGALQGAARYGLLNLPEPVAAADTDFNRAVSLAEFKDAALARFQLLDTAHQGRLTLPQLEVVRSAQLADGHRKHKDNAPDTRIGDPLPPPGH